MGREGNKINPELILALLQSKGIWRGVNVCLIFDLYILIFFVTLNIIRVQNAIVYFSPIKIPPHYRT